MNIVSCNDKQERATNPPSFCPLALIEPSGAFNHERHAKPTARPPATSSDKKTAITICYLQPTHMQTTSFAWPIPVCVSTWKGPVIGTVASGFWTIKKLIPKRPRNGRSTASHGTDKWGDGPEPNLYWPVS